MAMGSETTRAAPSWRHPYQSTVWNAPRCPLWYHTPFAPVLGGGKRSPHSTVSIAGSPAAGAATFKRHTHAENWKELPSILELALNLGNHGVHVGDTEEVAATVQELGVEHMRQVVMSASTPPGAPVFVNNSLQKKAGEGQPLVDTLATLPLSAQTKILLLGASLGRMSHYMRTVPYNALEPNAKMA